jgi:OOP family OmpA-OmpF porin
LPRTRPSFARAGAGARPLTALAGLGLVLAFTAGCSRSSAAPTPSVTPGPLAGTCLSNAGVPLTIVVGERSNVPSVQFPAATGTLLDTAANDRQPITLIRVDGLPKVFHVARFSPGNDVSNGAIQQDLDNYETGITELLDGSDLHAAVPQADVLGALSKAAAATPPGGNIIVIDSGLQTVAPLEYQQSGILMSPPADVVKFLRQENLIPDLRGRHVLLSGFGYTAAPQAALDQPEQQNVAAQWLAIAHAGGACATVDPTPNTNGELTGLPVVSKVPLPKMQIFRPCGTMALADDGSVGFNVGQTTFRDPTAARATLSRLASVLKPGTEHITLIGSTSTEGGPAINNPLSENRAKAVKSILVSLGISASRISVIGDGANYPGRVPDIGPNGRLLLPQAEQDREVIVQLPRCQ